MRFRFTATIASSGLLALTLGLLVPQSAAASTASDDVLSALTRVSEHATTAQQEILRSPGAAFQASESGASLFASSQGTTVAVPATASGAVSIASPQGERLTVSLPTTRSPQRAHKVAPNVAVLPGADRAQSAIVSRSDGSVQLLSIIQDRTAPTSFDYGIDSEQPLRLALQPDGSITGYTGESVPVLRILAPWATDANGDAVDTHYEIRGDSVIQVVDHTTPGVAYPVVADPQMLWFPWGYAFKFTHSETKKIANAASDTQALAIACGLIASAPGSVACGIAGFVLASFAANWVKGVARRGHCLQINTVWGMPGIPYEVTC